MDEGFFNKSNLILFKKILDSVWTGIYALDVNNDFIFFNPAMELISGLKRDEIIGKNLINDISEETYAGEGNFIHYFMKAKDRLEPVQYNNLKIITPERKISYQSGVIIPLLSKDQQYDGMVVTVEDTTKIVKSREALFEKNRLLDELNKNLQNRVEQQTENLIKSNLNLQLEQEKLIQYMDIAKVMIVAIDADETVSLINKHACDVLEGTKNNIIGLNWFDTFILPNERNHFREIFKQLLTDKYDKNLHTVKGIEHQIKTLKDKNRTILWHNVFLQDANGNPIGTLSSGQDITEQKILQEQLIINQRMDSIALLAGGIAHDFNNFLTSIIGNINLAKMELGEENDIVQTSLDDAEKACYLSKNLSNQLLTFSKGGEPHKTKVNLHDILSSAEGIALSGKKSSIKFSLPQQLWGINGDFNQLSQVFSNLFLNADEAMPEKGLIDVMAENIRSNSSEIEKLQLNPQNYVKISIKDQGVGIAEENLSKIFDLYYSTKRDNRGLGLPMVRSIVEKHDGLIYYESKVNKGTIVYIYLPAYSSDLEENIIDQIPEEPSDRINDLGGWKLLVMDDNEQILTLLERILTRLNIKTSTCVNGETCIELYSEALQKNDPFDVVILDLVVKDGMGGKTAIKKLREINPDICAIVSSGYSDNDVISNYKEYGFIDAIKKPFVLKDIKQVLLRTRNKNRNPSF